jgi:hypothetical protein
MAIRVAHGPADRLAPQSFEHVYDMPEWTIFEVVRCLSGSARWCQGAAVVRSSGFDRRRSSAQFWSTFQVLGEPMTGFRTLFEVAP